MTPSTVKLPELPALRITSKLGTHVGGRSSELRKGDVLYTTEQLTAAVLEDRRAREGELREVLELVRDLSSQEWQTPDGKRHAATDNQGRRFWFISEDVMEAVRAALSSTDGEPA